MVIQTVKVIPSSNLRPRWRTMEVGGFPRMKVRLLNTSKKDAYFALSEVSFLKLSNTRDLNIGALPGVAPCIILYSILYYNLIWDCYSSTQPLFTHTVLETM